MYDLIVIDKKKLKFARLIFRIGLILMVISAFGMIFRPELMSFKILLFVSAVPSFVGAFQISGFYRCPRCKESILSHRAFAALNEEYSSHCPRCGTKIEVEIRE